MIVASFDVPIVCGGVSIAAGERRVWGTSALRDARSKAGAARVYSSTKEKRLPLMGPRAGSTILIARTGGIGDLLMLTAAIDEAARRGLTIHVATSPRFRWVFERESVARICDLPIALDEYRRADYVTDLEGVMRDCKDRHAAIGFAARLGVRLADPTPRLIIDDVRHERARSFLRSIKRPRADRRLGIAQIHASSISRSFDPRWLRDVLLTTARECSIDWLLVGTDRTMLPNDLDESCVDLVGAISDVRDVAALVAHSAIAFSPDSALMHVGAALDVPCVCVFGPVDHVARSYATTVSMFAHLSCSPCWHHGALSCRVAIESGRRFSPCIDAIESSSIVAAMRRALDE